MVNQVGQLVKIAISALVGTAAFFFAPEIQAFTPGEVKLQPDDSLVTLTDVVISGLVASPPAGYYVSDVQRSSGIRIDNKYASWPYSQGMYVSLAGVIRTSPAGERYILAFDSITALPVKDIDPLTVTQRSLASMPFHYNAVTGAGQAGVTHPSEAWTNTVGQLIEVYGRVASVDSNYIHLEDGSLPSTYPVRVMRVSPTPSPSIGDRLTVTGMVSLTASGTDRIPLIIPRNSSDIINIDLPQPLVPDGIGVFPSGVAVQPAAPTYITLRFNQSSSSQIGYAEAVFSATGSTRNSVYIKVDTATNRFWLRNDGDTAWSEWITAGDNETLQNGSAILHGDGCSIVTTQSEMSIHLKVTFKAAVNGKRLYSYLQAVGYGARKQYGCIDVNSGVMNIDVRPIGNSLAASLPYSIHARYAHALGGSHVSSATLALSTSSSWVNAIALRYDAAQNKIYLRNDANTGWLGGLKPGTPGTISNNLATVDAANTKVFVEGSDLIVKWRMTLKSSAISKRFSVFMYSDDDSGNADYADEQPVGYNVIQKPTPPAP